MNQESKEPIKMIDILLLIIDLNTWLLLAWIFMKMYNDLINDYSLLSIVFMFLPIMLIIMHITYRLMNWLDKLLK